MYGVTASHSENNRRVTCCARVVGEQTDREKGLFTCRHACRSLTTLGHPASTLVALIKTTLYLVESECMG